VNFGANFLDTETGIRKWAVDNHTLSPTLNWKSRRRLLACLAILSAAYRKDYYTLRMVSDIRDRNYNAPSTLQSVTAVTEASVGNTGNLP